MMGACRRGLLLGLFLAAPWLPFAIGLDSDVPSEAGPLRIWIDEFFFAEGETALLREAAGASGGAAVVAGSTHSRMFQLKSYQLANKVDVMWTGQRGCYEAFKRQLNASHAVNCVPGTRAITGKAALATSLHAAYGERAWGLVPRSFHLPQQYPDMLVQMLQEQRSGHSGLWVLKEDAHRGKGVGVVTPAQAIARALEREPGGGPGMRHVLAQRFLGDQYLVDGRPFYVRLWAVLLGADPARALLFDGGVVVFGQQQREGQAADSLIVNLWTQDRAAAAPWSLGQLLQHITMAHGGPKASQRLQRQLRAAVAASLAAALPAVRQAASRLAGFQGGGFEVVGVDFLLDSTLRPWLVEVNQLPSLARKVVACATDASAPSNASSTGGAKQCEGDVPFDREKESFVHALLALLTVRHRGHASTARLAHQLLQEASKAAAEEEQPPCITAPQLQQLLAARAEWETADRLGFVSLTHQMYRSLACRAAGSAASSSSSSKSASSSSSSKSTSSSSSSSKSASSSDSSGKSDSSSSSSSCDVLAELAPPAPSQAQECSATAGFAVGLASRFQAWVANLRLQAAALLPRLRHPAARRRPGVATPRRPYTLADTDVRVLAWLDRGGPPLNSLQSLHAFCAGTGTAGEA